MFCSTWFEFGKETAANIKPRSIHSGDMAFTTNYISERNSLTELWFFMCLSVYDQVFFFYFNDFLFNFIIDFSEEQKVDHFL